MSEKATKIPQIRFDGYTDAWEQRKLGTIVEFFSGLTYSPDNIVPEDGTFVLRSSNVKGGELVNADNVYVDSSVVNSSNVQTGDIVVVVRNGSRDLIGKHAQVKTDMENTVIGAFMTGIRSKESNFINALLDTQQFKIEINKNLGATINQITTGAFKKMLFSVTPNIEEQQKIGSFFKQLDNTIALHQRECDLLAKMKKSYLQKMFPKNGEDKPEIRFAGFTDAWEQRKLGDCCEQIKETVDPQQNPDVKYWEYSMPAFDNGNKPDLVYGSGMNSIRKVINTSCLLINKLNVRKKRIWLVETPLNNSVCSAEFVPIVSENVDLRFIKYIVSENKFTRYLEDCSSGSSNSQKRVTPDVIMSAVIKVPTIAEQQKVGEYFSNLDRLITLHQRELDSLKKMKKSLLQMMFV